MQSFRIQSEDYEDWLQSIETMNFGLNGAWSVLDLLVSFRVTVECHTGLCFGAVIRNWKTKYRHQVPTRLNNFLQYPHSRLPRNTRPHTQDCTLAVYKTEKYLCVVHTRLQGNENPINKCHNVGRRLQDYSPQSCTTANLSPQSCTAANLNQTNKKTFPTRPVPSTLRLRPPEPGKTGSSSKTIE